jgi:hypothetical protein
MLIFAAQAVYRSRARPAFFRQAMKEGYLVAEPEVS